MRKYKVLKTRFVPGVPEIRKGNIITIEELPERLISQLLTQKIIVEEIVKPMNKLKKGTE